MNHQNIVFDFDSTLVTIEGIDELANQKGLKTAVAELTAQAMSGDADINTVFKQRLKLIDPVRKDILDIAQLYRHNITMGARELIDKLTHLNVWVITGGYLEAVLPVTKDLGIKDENVFANRLLFNKQGSYLGLDESIPLWKQGGKKEVLQTLLTKHPGKTVVIGDGYSDYEMATIADTFICFAGVEYREKVADLADVVIREQNLLQVFAHL